MRSFFVSPFLTCSKNLVVFLLHHLTCAKHLPLVFDSLPMLSVDLYVDICFLWTETWDFWIEKNGIVVVFFLDFGVFQKEAVAKKKGCPI